MPEIILIEKKENSEYIYLFNSIDKKKEFVINSQKLRNEDLEKTVKEYPVLRQTKSIGVHLHLIF